MRIFVCRDEGSDAKKFAAKRLGNHEKKRRRRLALNLIPCMCTFVTVDQLIINERIAKLYLRL